MRKTEKREKKVRGFRDKIWSGSIVAALVAAVAVFGVMLRLEKNMLAGYERGKIFVTAQKIPKGTIINEGNLTEFFREEELDKKLIAESMITEPEHLLGMVAGNVIDCGAIVTGGMLESLNEIVGNMEEPVIAGFRAEDLYQVVGGTLRNGDRIHIYNVEEDGNAVLVWSDLYVQQAFDNSGASILPGEENKAAQRVNIYLNKDEVEMFYSKLSAGSLRVVKACD